MSTKRPGWLPPMFIALTDTTGTTVYLDAKRIAGVGESPNSGDSIIWMDGLTGSATVRESPQEVFTEWAGALR